MSNASAPSLTSVAATFSERLDAATGSNAANYSVFETANPGNTVSVSSVSLSVATATLTLGASLTAGTNYTLRVQNVQDVAGNPMAG